jgi:hypothetical protein
MTTAVSLITSAMRLCKVVDSDETPDPGDLQIGLDVLNAMLGLWSLENLTVYRVLEQSFTVTPGNGSYTIGDGGVFDSNRPAKIDSAFVRVSGVDYPVTVLPKQLWDQIPDKSAQGDFVSMLFYDPAYPLGIIHVWPVPRTSQDLHINTMQQFTEAADAYDDLALPPGYELAIKYNLAVALAPELNALVSELVLGIARSSKATIKRKNIRNNVSQFDIPTGSARRNILLG